LLLTLILTTLSLSAQLRDGTLMRSESIYTFDATKAKGDFYVSPRGNDNWSGTLAEPNAAGTDGPFASINRAQQGVRDLKAQVYQSKKTSNISQYNGSNHPFGKVDAPAKLTTLHRLQPPYVNYLKLNNIYPTRMV
jgi:hypothetical protein